MSSFPTAPPMDYPPQPMQPGMPGPRKANGWAIASLICGILGCVPWVTGLLAVVFGILGLRAARDPQTGGKGLAIAGLVLGLISIVLWTLFGGAMLALFRGTAEQRDIARQFINDLAAGNVAAAQARCTPAVSRQDLESAAAQFKQWGTVQDVTLFGVSARAAAGEATTTEVVGAVTFPQQTVAFRAELVAEGETHRINEFELEPQ